MLDRIGARLLPLLGGTLLLASPSVADDPAPVADKDVTSYVDRRVEEWQPTTDEKRFDQIGWCTSLLQAEELARKHDRPIFLFTHDGKMQVGRC
jgi:hypothetical protein